MATILNNDAARRWTDAELEALERNMRREYQRAAKEMRGKQAEWLEKFNREREQREKALDDTKEAMEAHKAWLRSQTARSEWLDGMVNGLSESAHSANVKATDMVNDHIPHVFAGNANRAAFAIEGKVGRDVGFTLVNEDAVRHLMGLPLQGGGGGQLVKEVVDEAAKLGPGFAQSLRKREMDYPRDMRWNRQKFTSAITQGILQGDSIPHIVERTESIFGQNMNAAIRAARTATTNAENAGRMSTFERAEKLGIDMEIEWQATLDERTRESHRQLDGERIKLGEHFETEDGPLRWPGDPLGPDSQTWNCRCRADGRVVGFDGERGEWADDAEGERWARLPEGMTYDEWKEAKAVSRDLSYENDWTRVSGDWYAEQAAETLSGAAYATPERIAELESVVASYEAEVDELARKSVHVPEDTAKMYQAEVDKHAARMAENEWARGLDIDALNAESNRLYAEQDEIWQRRRELKRAARNMEGAEFDAAMAEVERLKAEYDEVFSKVDEIDRRIDALRAYERAQGEHAYYSEKLAEAVARRDTALAARAENERLLAEARIRRNRAYGELSDAQPFAPNVRKQLGDGYANALESRVSAAEERHPEISAVYRRFSSQLRITVSDMEDGAHYSQFDRGIHFNAEAVARGSSHKEPYSTAFHEFGHLIDHAGGYGGVGRSTRWATMHDDLTAIIKKDWMKFRNAEGKKMGVRRDKNGAVIAMLNDEKIAMGADGKKAFSAVSDIIEGCTGESYPLGFGHGASYHRRNPGYTGLEFFAETFESAMANEAQYQQLKRIFPNAVKKVEDIARGMLE